MRTDNLSRFTLIQGASWHCIPSVKPPMVERVSWCPLGRSTMNWHGPVQTWCRFSQRAQVEALKAVQMLAERHALRLDLEPGDLLFLNNLGLLHARNGFTDSSEQKRHLIRLWLHNDEQAWPIPLAIRQPWEDAFQNSSQTQLWPLEPITDRQYVTTQQRSSGHG